MRLTTIRHAAVLGLLLCLFGLLVFSVEIKSPTADEQNHVARGLAYLKTGDLRLSQEHPPGVNAWLAWPLLFDPNVSLPLDSPSWENAEWYGFADEFLWWENDRPQAIVFSARVPIVWLTVILAALVYRWARALGGGWAGLVALAVVAFDPNILAHGRLATNDLGVTCLSVVAMWALWRAVRAQRAPGVSTWGHWAAAGVAFGAAQLSKFSALILGPVVLVVVGLAAAQAWVRCGSFTWRSVGRWVLALLLLFAMGGAVIWAGYSFTWGPIDVLGGVSGPAPAYWDGIAAILRRTGGGSPAFLMGQYSETGWWYYFPVAFAIKTPLPTLILLLLALVLAFRPAVPGGLPLCLTCLLLPPLAFWVMAIAGSFNVGYRHILPTLPFLYVLVGWQVGTWVEPRHARPADDSRRSVAGASALLIPVVLLGWLVASTAFAFPHYLAFFNAIVGGPSNGYRYLVDSNLDWGQDLPGLRHLVEAQGGERVLLSWFGAAYPEAYELTFHPTPGFWRFRGDPAAYGLNPYAPGPGMYAISASNLQGIKLADRDTYAWFRQKEPDGDVGHSVLIYCVEGSKPDSAVVLGIPMSQLADAERALLGRGASVRRYDPATGAILPLSLAPERTWYVAPEAPEEATVVRDGPEYVVFQLPPGPAKVDPGRVRFGSHVHLVDHEIGPAGSEKGDLVVRTEWGVLDPPHRASVSFAHLLDAQGRYLVGWDGLSAPATCWQDGDLLRQTYRITLPKDLPAGVYQVEIGWYDAETLERWPCTVDGEHVGDRFLLEGVEVRP